MAPGSLLTLGSGELSSFPAQRCPNLGHSDCRAVGERRRGQELRPKLAACLSIKPGGRTPSPGGAVLRARDASAVTRRPIQMHALRINDD